MLGWKAGRNPVIVVEMRWVHVVLGGVVLVSAGIGSPMSALGQSQTIEPVIDQQNAEQIIEQAVARANEQRLAAAGLRYEATIEAATEHLDGEGDVERTERMTYRQYPLEGVVFEELVAKEGEPLSEEDAQDERERREKFITTIRERRAKGEPAVPEDENRVEFNEEFVSRYRFSLLGQELVDGYLCWVIDLEPNDGDLPVRRRIDNALNNAVGRVWVSQSDYGLVRVEFEMNKPVKFWGGILGTLRNTVGHLEFTQVSDGTWLPTTIDIKLDLRILFRSIRRRFVREWVEYAPVRIAD